MSWFLSFYYHRGAEKTLKLQEEAVGVLCVSLTPWWETPLEPYSPARIDYPLRENWIRGIIALKRYADTKLEFSTGCKATLHPCLFALFELD